jgi:hypothetical protein
VRAPLVLYDNYNSGYKNLSPLVLGNSVGSIVLGTCTTNTTRTVTRCTRPNPTVCASNIQLQAIGVNTKYYLGDTTTTNRNAYVKVNVSTLTAAGDTNITDIWFFLWYIYQNKHEQAIRVSYNITTHLS